MNMIKKIAMGMGAFGLVASMVGCGDSSGGSVSELTTTTTGKVVSVDGTIDATSKIFDVTYTLADAKGAAITGAIYAYSVKDAAVAAGVNADSVLSVNIGKGAAGVPGLDVQVFLADIDSVHCGDLTLTVIAQVETQSTMGGGTGEAEEVSSSVVFNMPCGVPSTAVEDPTIPEFDPEDLAAALTSKTDSVGGAKAKLGSSYDVDANLVYSSTTVGPVVNAIDFIFNGTKVMTPYGTAETGYMSNTFKTSTSEAVLIPVAATADPKTVEELGALINVDAATNVIAVSANTAFLVITSEGIPALVKISTIGTTQVMTFVTMK